MVHVYWLEQTDANVPEENDWLSAGEVLLLDAMAFPKRRADWRLGRWTAKCAIATHLNTFEDRQTLATIEIRPALSGAPEVFLANQVAPVSISISHRSGLAACVVTHGTAALGCDLEIAEPRSHGFITDYFTGEEQALIAKASELDREWVVALLWSGKESVLKALHQGLRLPTQSVVVTPLDVLRPAASGAPKCAQHSDRDSRSRAASGHWSSFVAQCTSGQMFQGWWQRSGNLLRTMVADPAAEVPTPQRNPSRDKTLSVKSF
jgi:4'-phosphopantetheinyl transferase